MKPTRIVLLAAVLLTLVFPALAKSPTTPGQYTDWGPDIDSIEIVSTFDASDYDSIVIGEFGTASTPRPKKGDNTVDAVKSALAAVESNLAEGVKKESSLKVSSGESGKGRSLLVRGRVLEMDPGSRAGRYWSGGFGGGAAAAQISGEIVDARSGKVLVRFTQRRKSGGGMRVGGGNYTTVLNACVRSLGKDIANIIKAF